MAIFPEIFPDYGYSFFPNFSTELLGPTEGDFTQSRSHRSEPLYTAMLTYSYLEPADERTLFNFFISQKGRKNTFKFFDFVSKNYTGESIGTGDASTKIFVFNFRDVENETIYINGSSVSSSTYSITKRDATKDYRSTITFTTAPAQDAVITGDFDGKKYLPYCRFNADSLKDSFVMWQYYNIMNIVINQVNG